MDSATRLFYLDEHTLMVVTPKGKIKLLHTPFRVKCIKEADRLKPGRLYLVEKVKGKGNLIFFTINRFVYPHSLFLVPE
jgi:hypothetical protein